jgi:hypothetical protein
MMRRLNPGPFVQLSTNHSVQLSGYANADWGNDTTQRKSRYGYILTLGTGAISYRSRQQTCVA